LPYRGSGVLFLGRDFLRYDRNVSIAISQKNEARLKATADAQGVSPDAYLEILLNERDAVAAVVHESASKLPQLSMDEVRSRIERSFVQSETCEVADGEEFTSRLLSRLQ